MRKQKRIKYSAYCIIKFQTFTALCRRCTDGGAILLSIKEIT